MNRLFSLIGLSIVLLGTSPSAQRWENNHVRLIAHANGYCHMAGYSEGVVPRSITPGGGSGRYRFACYGTEWEAAHGGASPAIFFARL